jgi:hypothetical protein
MQMNRATKELTGETETPVQTNRSTLDQSCVVEAWRSVQSEVHQDNGHLASVAGVVQATLEKDKWCAKSAERK